MQCWYSIKTDARCFVCQVLARLFALKAIQRGLEQMAGRSCLCYFWTFPLKLSDCCPFSPLPPLMYVFLPSFLSAFLLENMWGFFKAYIINKATSPISCLCFCWTKLWIFYFCLPKFGESLFLKQYERRQEGKLSRGWEARLPFWWVQLNSSTFPIRSAAVLSPGSKFRLRVSDKTTLVTCMTCARGLHPFLRRCVGEGQL